MLNIGVIGYGTAAQVVCDTIESGRLGEAKLCSVLVRDINKYRDLLLSARITDSAETFFSHSFDVVVEAAGHTAVQVYGLRVLSMGADLLISSVGALGDSALYEELMLAALKTRSRIHLPSAAIAGLDRIAAAREDGLTQVRLTTRKPIKAWRGTYAEEVVDLDSITEPVAIFSGNARDSSRLFPESVNVSAALSLAGIGFEKTEVQVIVDPTIERNIHQVFATGKFGVIDLQVQNTPSPENPKTGYIVAMSMCKVLRGFISPLQVGI